MIGLQIQGAKQKKPKAKLATQQSHEIVKKNNKKQLERIEPESITVDTAKRFQIDADLAKFLDIEDWSNFKEITVGLLRFNKKTGGGFYDKERKCFNAFKFPYLYQFFPHLQQVKK